MRIQNSLAEVYGLRDLATQNAVLVQSYLQLPEIAHLLKPSAWLLVSDGVKVV